MKSALSILILVPLLWNMSVFGQISVISTDLPVVGDTMPFAKDVFDPLVHTFNVGSAGANQVWDYSYLTADQLYHTYAVAPNTTPDGAAFPNANIAYTNTFTSYLYAKNTTSTYSIEGFAGEIALGIQATVDFTNTYDQYRFSVDYQDSYTDDYAFTEIIPFGDLPKELRDAIEDQLPFGVTVTRVRMRFSATFTHTVDAFGTAITPLGSYDCLRQKRVESSETRIDAETSTIFGTSWNDDIDIINSNTTDYQWLTKVTKLPVITLEYDTARNVTAANYSLIPPVPNAGFTYAEGSTGSVNFTNTSENSPVSYSWDFGDGNSSSDANPGNVYATNGAYYVCLTATNSTGSDMFCDSVHVTTYVVIVNNPPVANDDTIYLAHSAGFAISPLNNDSDPDGDNITLTSFSSPALGSAVSAGATKIQYTAPYGYCGLDSFTYVICDDGSPVMCDTATILIVVDSCVTHSINLNSGWNLTSSYVIPQNLNIQNVFNPIVSDLLIVKNCVGASYIPSFGINTIGNWIIEEAYKLKTSASTVLDLTGPLVNPVNTPVSLSTGWNCAAYLRTSPLNAAAAFDGVSSEVILVKDINGNSYIPAFGINTIGDLEPGQGYKVKMSGPASLVYPGN